MNEIKPTWKIAQQVSKRHTYISLLITLPTIVLSWLIVWLVLNILGVSHPHAAIDAFCQAHRRQVISCITFFHLVPVNYYAIIRTFNGRFKKFQIKVFSSDD